MKKTTFFFLTVAVLFVQRGSIFNRGVFRRQKRYCAGKNKLKKCSSVRHFGEQMKAKLILKTHVRK